MQGVHFYRGIRESITYEMEDLQIFIARRVRENPIIYDKNHPGCVKRQRKNSVWVQIVIDLLANGLVEDAESK